MARGVAPGTRMRAADRGADEQHRDEGGVRARASSARRAQRMQRRVARSGATFTRPPPRARRAAARADVAGADTRCAPRRAQRRRTRRQQHADVQRRERDVVERRRRRGRAAGRRRPRRRSTAIASQRRRRPRAADARARPPSASPRSGRGGRAARSTVACTWIQKLAVCSANALNVYAPPPSTCTRQQRQAEVRREVERGTGRPSSPASGCAPVSDPHDRERHVDEHRPAGQEVRRRQHVLQLRSAAAAARAARRRAPTGSRAPSAAAG